VKHGHARGLRGTNALDARRSEQGVLISIENPGEYRGPRAGSHGLPTLERRLDLAYDGAASMSVTGKGPRTHASVVVPTTGPRVAA
jgi:hypothetical protein